LGDRRWHIEGALESLRRTPAVEVIRVSSLRETDPMGGPAGQGRYLNAAAELGTTLGPRELLARLQAIEAASGRVRSIPNAPRPLDLDILLYGDLIMNDVGLVLPHPRMGERRFVLEPLAEIAATRVHPVFGLCLEELRDRLRRGEEGHST
jgi:2-amino-4-hydroxy-6-hydroxymethyldihydropteridine diphosphokinase